MSTSSTARWEAPLSFLMIMSLPFAQVILKLQNRQSQGKYSAETSQCAQPLPAQRDTIRNSRSAREDDLSVGLT